METSISEKLICRINYCLIMAVAVIGIILICISISNAV